MNQLKQVLALRDLCLNLLDQQKLTKHPFEVGMAKVKSSFKYSPRCSAHRWFAVDRNGIQLQHCARAGTVHLRRTTPLIEPVARMFWKYLAIDIFIRICKWLEFDGVAYVPVPNASTATLPQRAGVLKWASMVSRKPISLYKQLGGFT